MKKNKLFRQQSEWPDEKPIRHYKTTSELVRTVLAIITLIVQIIILIHVV